MYSLPSTSNTCDPFARLTKKGCPPTARKARTGEFTPPGMHCSASANKASERARERTVMPELSGKPPPKARGKHPAAISIDPRLFVPARPEHHFAGMTHQ